MKTMLSLLSRAVAIVVSLLALVTIPSRVAATDDYAQSVTRAYLNGLGYANVTFLHASFYGACPQGFYCLGWTAIVTFTVSSNGEGASSALVTGGSRCPTCGTVLIAGGGALDVASIESYGVPASQAQDMVNQFNLQ